MKAIIYYEDGTVFNNVDVWYDGKTPLFADTMERNFMEVLNRNTPPNGCKVVKVKIFRNGSIRTPKEVYEQMHPRLFKEEPPKPTIGDCVDRKCFAPSKKGKKRTIKIW